MSNMVVYGYGFSSKLLATIRGNLTSVALVVDEYDQLHPNEGLMLVYSEWAAEFLHLLPEGARVPKNTLVYGSISSWGNSIRHRFPQRVDGDVLNIHPFVWKFGIRSRRAVLEAEVKLLKESLAFYESRAAWFMLHEDRTSTIISTRKKLQKAEAALREFKASPEAEVTDEEILALTLIWSRSGEDWVATCPEAKCEAHARTKEQSKRFLCEMIRSNALELLWQRWNPPMGEHLATLVMVYEDRLDESFTEVDQEPALT